MVGFLLIVGIIVAAVVAGGFGYLHVRNEGEVDYL